LPGGPAALSNKLNSGDRITGVGQGDDQDILDVVGWRLDDVVDLIRGPKESIVRLEILPKTEPIGGKTRVVKIRRDTIRLEEQAAKQSLLNISIEGAIKIFGVITIPTFYVDFDAKGRGDKDYRSTTRDVRALILELEEYDIDGLIVDLRGNGGGALSEAISVTGLFIKSGPIVQVRETQGKVNIRKDPDPNILYSGPLIILVDRDSASASEIFAGALQDYKRGLVVGEPTFGKGTVQNLVDLDQFSKNNSAGLGQLKVTIAQFFRISGDGTQHRGVVPDLLLPEVQYRRDQRESSNINAMPWSAIKPTRYREFKTLTLSESSIDKIYQYHIKRIQNNPQFQYLLQKTKLDSTLAEQTSFSLLETRRRTERDLQAQKIQQLREEYLNDGLHESNDFLNSESLVNELVLLETAHILSDIIKENSTTPR